ncbi:MAG: PA14 domain-containing protein [Akkermansiaceae bacterium]
MARTLFTTLAAVVSSVTILHAQDGEQLYNLHCSACHAPDGKGATGGAFPPLAGSEWVHGNPKRSVAIVLKGLQGPIEVGDKSYNLVMPPHEASLSDNNITAILNYVHSAWGNRGEQMKRDVVRTVRAEFESRETPWTAPELLKLYPLPKKESPLKNLTSRIYKGQWNRVPDFSKIQAENIEEEHDGEIDISISPLKDRFGIVWEGQFEAKENEIYEFFLDVDDGARVIIGGKKVVEVNGLGPMNGSRAKTSTVKLKQGLHAFRTEYYEFTGQQGLSIGWKIKGKGDWKWLTPEAALPKKKYPDIYLTPDDGKAVIYRNFIEGLPPRAIGFGFPGGLNLAYSADHLAPELLWLGEFINAGRHWTNRGQGNEPPASKEAVRLTAERFLPKSAKFKGYSLDSTNNPTFLVQVGKGLLKDSWKPSESGSFLRTLELTGDTSTLEIPSGSPELTGMETIKLEPNKPVTVTYKLK